MVNAMLWGFALFYATWIFYLAIMNLYRVKDKLSPPAKLLGYPTLAIGGALDFLFNVLVGSVLFLEAPRELLFTRRLERHIREGTGRRHDLAKWCCVNLLDQFDPRGRHCG